MTKSSIVDLRNVDFVLHEVLEVETLTRYPRFAEHSRETFDLALASAHRVALTAFAPHHRKGDVNEPRVQDGKVVVLPEVAAALAAYRDAGFTAMTADEASGGMQLPHVVALACDAMFFGANVATAGYALLARGVANLLEAHGSPEQRRLYMDPILRGRYLGTMCLSEPQAGSSLADITMRAELAPEGDHYLLRGSKMWISGGDHEIAENIVHLVLAKIPGGPPGVRGISLFVVPRFLVRADGTRGSRNDVTLVGLNHKMGQRGIVNTALSLGDEGRCVGYLVGEPHRGLAQMFHMMNEARLGVGMGATMSGYAGYLYALAYARERRQGRHPDLKDPSSPPVPLVEHADVRRMLVAQRAYVEGAFSLGLYAARLVDRARHEPDAASRKAAGELLDLLTPVVKTWSAEHCTRANDLAIQVLGGYGYSREYPVELHYRDNRLNAIHEGTSGIQALDLLGRKVMAEGGAPLAALGAEIARTCADAATLPELRPLAHELAAKLALVSETTKAVAALMARGEVRPALANANAYATLFGHVTIAWTWLREATVAARALPRASEEDAAFYRGKIQTCRWFFASELPTVDHAAALVARGDRTAFDMQPGWF